MNFQLTIRLGISYLLIAAINFPNFSQIKNNDLSLFFDFSNHFVSESIVDGIPKWSEVQNSSDLISLRELIKEIKLENETEVSKKAFFINAYNLILIDEISAAYPVTRTTDIKGLFDKTKHKINGMKMTLNELEEMLITNYREPRICFVIFKGNKSSPKLLNKGIHPNNIEFLLSKRSKEVINNSTFVFENKDDLSITLSEIFKRHEVNFEFSGGLIKLINSYRTDPIPEHYHFIFKESNNAILK